MKKDLWQRAEEIFHTALERPPEARRAFLDEACGDDAELRRQVEMLVSKDEQAGSFLDKPALADVKGFSMIGQTIAHYRIVEKLGQGGMGEVYRAHDSKLGRDVAIKLLPSEFARDPDRIARFNREAKLLASLNHPNIAAIHGLEESGGTNFLVLELAEGQTLADRIKAGPIPIEESLKLALQIAEALEAAHEKGVIHRDLKPANIKLTPEGKVKVLDFGLAKAFAGEQAEVNLSNSPTLSNAATQQGVILGTAAYMSPEQARGKTVDKRTDVWAFGCVLFEMLTGRAAFKGDDVSDILASVIRSEPDWSKLPANLHWRLREILDRCLKKDARDRYHDISDVRIDIQKAAADPEGMAAQGIATAEPRMKLRTILPWVASALVLGLIIAGAAVWKWKPPEPRPIWRFYHELPEGQQFSDLSRHVLAVSPDGQKIVYGTSKGLYIRSADELTARLIAGTEESTTNPFFSPDGQWIGYYSIGKLKKISVNGGAPTVLCDAGTVMGSWWNEDNTIVFGQWARDIMRVSADGGTPESIVKRKSLDLRDPQILPDGKSILYTSGQKIMVRSLKAGEPKELFSGSAARYFPTGHILYGLPNNSNLFAIPFDVDKLEVTGGGVPIIEGVMDYAIGNSGVLAYIPGTSGGTAVRQILVWVDREGKEEPLSAPLDEYWVFRISPDGKRVALTVGTTPKSDIWIWDIARETRTRLTLEEGANSSVPLWTPDGKRIFYCSSRDDVAFGDLYWRAADGTGVAEKFASAQDRGLWPYSWSRDGKILVLFELTRDPMQADIGTLSMEGDHAMKGLLQEKYNETDPHVSPDGRWIAYGSNESGKTEIYVRPFPDVNKGKYQISTNGGINPLWSPDSCEIFYRSGDATMRVRVEAESTFGKPRVIFRGAFVSRIGTTPWDISPDGKRFLMAKEAKASEVEVPRKINVVINWFEELKQRVPGK